MNDKYGIQISKKTENTLITFQVNFEVVLNENWDQTSCYILSIWELQWIAAAWSIQDQASDLASKIFEVP